MPDQPTVADAARRYAAAGWPVHPLHDTAAGHCSCTEGPDCRQPGKHPRTAHGFHDATISPKKVAAWWRRWPHANVGVSTGSASQLAVIDLDGLPGVATWEALTAKHGGPSAATATAMTPHGRHHWYRLPDGLHVLRSIRRLGDGIDVLGDDGYAIAPPSAIAHCSKQHEDGERCKTGYAWIGPIHRLAPMPAWIPRRLEERAHVADQLAGDVSMNRRIVATRSAPVRAQPPSPAGRGRVRDPRRYAIAALRGEADRVSHAPMGQRNDMLNYAAWRLAPNLHNGALSEPEIRRALVRAADACGLTKDDGARAVHTTITSALRSGGRCL